MDNALAATNRPASADSAVELSAVIIGALLGEYSLLIVPFIVAAMMQGYGLSEDKAGNLVALQLFGMALAGVAVSYSTRRAPARLIVIGACALISIANVLCAIGSSDSILELGRALTGLGEGSLMAAAGAIAANVRNPHRLFSILGLVIAVVAAIALLITPFLFDHVGPRAVFWFLSACPLVGILLAGWLPQGREASADAPRLGALAVPGAAAALAAFGLLWIGASALWVFAERIGAAQHFSLEEVGTYLAIGQVAGIAGPIIAVRYGERYGLHRSLAIGSAVMAAGGLLMVYGSSAWSYATGVSLLSAAVMFLTPCFRSLMASLDSTGSVIAMSVTFYTVGFGIAPLIVSAIHTSGNDYGSVAWLAAAAFAVSGVLAFMSKSHLLQV